MRIEKLLNGTVATLCALLVLAAQTDAVAQGAAALTGTVTSDAEGQMEGVVVSARRDGATFTVSVVSDAQGQFRFPRTHLVPGTYVLSVRAVGYDLVGPRLVEVTAGAPATRDLTLDTTTDLASQLSSIEWLMSMPGTPDQKGKLVHQLLSCAYCHTYERIMKSRYSAEEMVPVIGRMTSYFQDGTAVGRGGRGRAVQNESPGFGAQGTTWGFSPPVPRTELAEYLASVNLSDGRTTWPYELKTLPRPTGQATRVIMTQYDMPRRGTVPHDVEVDADGVPWYGDQSRMYIGRLDPTTGVFTEYPLPELPAGRVGGISDVHLDLEGRLWFPMTSPTGASHFGSPAMFDPRTEELTKLDYPDDQAVQFIARGPDGKIWMNSVATVIRIDPQTMEVDATFNLNNAENPAPGPHAFYQLGVNSKGDAYGTDWLGSYIVGINGDTGTMRFFETPTRSASPRRGKMDAQDRFWFAEYTGDRIAMFDTNTEAFQEWPVREYSTPYAASLPDKDGYVYASSNMAEQVVRLDPETGEVVEYQIPTDFDSKEILHDPSTDRVVLWLANVRNARLLRIEPLD